MRGCGGGWGCAVRDDFDGELRGHWMGKLREGFDFVVLLAFQFGCLLDGEAVEADGVARAELADFPELGLDDGGGADEAAEAGAIGAEDDGHVAGEIDGADGVGVVVDVRGVQAGFAAVVAGPLGWGR